MPDLNGDKMPAWGVPGETPDEGEWPRRDAVPFVMIKEVVVTPEMIAAGVGLDIQMPQTDVEAWDRVTATYRAMAALAPVPLETANRYAYWRRLAMLGLADPRCRDTIARMTTEKPGDHPYNGPTAPDAEGKRRSIPDVVHERFHQSVGDVLSGDVLPEAREQMRDALDRVPKDKTPFPVKASGMTIGLRLP